ncbi:MAG: MFS transporter [Chloroflexi bacterium]|nr:MFS transporter [Chloroflexota bacterium]
MHRNGAHPPDPKPTDVPPVDNSVSGYAEAVPGGDWRRVVWTAGALQAVVVIGFSFVFPFLSLFVQELGITEPRRAAFWGGLALGIPGLLMFLSSPVWGAIADRYGRKKVVVYTSVAAGAVLIVSGLVTNVYQLVALRALGGLVAGSMIANMGLVAAASPRSRVRYSMGVFQGMSYIGLTVGPMIGGFTAEAIGFRGNFFAAGGTLVGSALLYQRLVPEPALAPGGRSLQPANLLREITGLAQVGGMVPLLLLLFLNQLAANLMTPVLPVHISALSGGENASLAGLAFSLLNLLGAAGAYSAAMTTQRLGLPKLMLIACLFIAVAYVGIALAGHVAIVLGLVALVGLASGIIITTNTALVAEVVPRDRQGTAYGLVQSASSLGFGAGPLMGGGVATAVGLRGVFFLDALSYVALSAIAFRLAGITRQRGAPPPEEGGTAKGKAPLHLPRGQRR